MLIQHDFAATFGLVALSTFQLLALALLGEAREIYKRDRAGNNNPRFRSFLRCGAEIICHGAFSIQEIRQRDATRMIFPRQKKEGRV